jgi:hypothetical protein
MEEGVGIFADINVTIVTSHALVTRPQSYSLLSFSFISEKKIRQAIPLNLRSKRMIKTEERMNRQ